MNRTPPTRATAVTTLKQQPTNSKIGGLTKLGDRAVATASAPSEQIGKGESRSDYYTYFTKVPANGTETPILFTGDRLWTKVTLTLETAGPVVVGTVAQLQPVLSGKGIRLTTGQAREFFIAKGSKLYVQATAVNRVAVSIEALPWLEQITGYLAASASSVGESVASALQRMFKR